MSEWLPPKFLLLILLGTRLCSAQTTAGPAPQLLYQPPAPSSPEVIDALLNVTPPALRLQTDDVISITVFEVPELQIPQQRVPEDGLITLPLVGRVQASGHTLVEVQDAIAAKLTERRLVKEAQVLVTATALPSRMVAATGEFLKPGLFPETGALKLADFVAQAQGFGVGASGSIVLIRRSLPHPVVIPLGPSPEAAAYGNIPILPGDTINAPRAGVVYAVGAFKTQGSYVLKNTTPTTVLQLVSLAGGVGYEGDMRSAQIMRVKDGKYILIHVPLRDILHGKRADVALMNDDVLFVPTNEMRAAVKGGGIGLIVSLATTFALFRQ